MLRITGGRVYDPANGVNGEVRFTVADTARPIAKDDIPMLFDPYHWRNVSEPHRGAGLGLAIAKGIVEAHGGQIALETEPDVGNVFVFTIPVAHPVDQKLEAPARARK